MDRRHFLVAIGSLALVQRSSGAEGPAVFWVDRPGEWLGVHCGWIFCVAERLPNGRWALEVWPNVKQLNEEGGYKERRLVPAPLLKQRLAQQDLALDFEPPPCRILPPLVGEIETGSALELFWKVSRAVDGFGPDELCSDSWPEDWGTYLLPAPLPEDAISLPLSRRQARLPCQSNALTNVLENWMR